jgi:signal transduction histidine kinase
VLADRERLALALACLVDNALKFGPESEAVTLGVILDRAAVRIEVRDLGRRIPDDQIERIFRSFYQLESPLTRQRGGAGVGLYLARQLVERMGGRIWADNRRGRGNVFCITLSTDT